MIIDKQGKKAGLLVVVERILRLASSLLIGVLLARHLGPVDFGALSFAQSLIAILCVICGLGQETVVVQRLVRQSDRDALIVGSAFYSSLIAGLLILSIILGFYSLRDTLDTTNVLIAIISATLPLQAFNVLSYYLQANQRIDILVKIQILQLLASLGCRATLLIYQTPIIYFAIATVIDVAIFSALQLCVTRRLVFRIIKQNITTKYIKALFLNTWPLIFAVLSTNMVLRIDQVMIERYMGLAAVGHFSVSSRILEAGILIPISLYRILMPKLIKSATVPTEYRKNLQALYDVITLTSLPVIILSYFFSASIIDLLFGPLYAAAAPVLQIFAVLFFAICITQIISNAMTIEGSRYHAINRAIATIIILVPLNTIAIPLLGLNGAAISTIAAILLASVISCLSYRASRHHLLMIGKSILIYPAILRTYNLIHPK